MNLLSFFLSFLFSALVTWCMIPRIILISYKKNLFDNIDERKVHKGIVPRLGGVAFVPALVFSFALLFGVFTLMGYHLQSGESLSLRLTLSLCALLILYFEGVTDDLIGVGYKVKFLVQFICALLIVGSGVWLNSLYGLFGIYELPWFVGQPLSVVLIVYIINAINLIDGIDGLASGLSIVALFFLGVLFAENGSVVSACVSFAMLGALIPFFYFNVFGKADKHNKIFMGDCGSQIVGLVVGMLAVHYAMFTPSNVTNAGKDTLVVAFCVLMIPCLDVIRVMMGRLRRGKNPFLPDKTHIHHKFLNLGMSHRTAMLTILMLDTVFILLNIGIVRIININIILAADIVLFTLLQIWLSQLVKRRNSLTKE